MLREELFVLKLVSPLLNSQIDEDKNLVARLLAENIMLRSILMERPRDQASLSIASQKSVHPKHLT